MPRIRVDDTTKERLEEAPLPGITHDDLVRALLEAYERADATAPLDQPE